jgi:hypothetical protein
MEARVYAANERPFDSIRAVAVAIAAVDREQRHVGILHRDRSLGEVQLLHLAWHYDLRNSRPKPCYLWIDPPIPEARARQVAALCRRVSRSNIRGIPYAFSAPNDCFDPITAQFLLGPERRGLTCASFVLAIFDAAGLALVDHSTWPSRREADARWQQQVLAQLREVNATPEHLEAVRSEIGNVRYRPEEVAGAAASESLPAPFPDARRRADAILEKLDRLGLTLE